MQARHVMAGAASQVVEEGVWSWRRRQRHGVALWPCLDVGRARGRLGVWLRLLDRQRGRAPRRDVGRGQGEAGMRASWREGGCPCTEPQERRSSKACSRTSSVGDRHITGQQGGRELQRWVSKEAIHNQYCFSGAYTGHSPPAKKKMRTRYDTPCS